MLYRKRKIKNVVVLDVRSVAHLEAFLIKQDVLLLARVQCFRRVQRRASAIARLICWSLLSPNWDFSQNVRLYQFLPLRHPKFMRSFEKVLWATLEKKVYLLTYWHTDSGEIIGTVFFYRWGSNNLLTKTFLEL